MSAEVREAQERDLAVLAGIEDAADALLVERFPGWEPGGSATGAERAAEPGFLLVAGDPPVGFVHVLELAGDISLSSDPAIGFAYRPGEADAFTVLATDSDGASWQGSFPIPAHTQ